jgi:hypothetical protein
MINRYDRTNIRIGSKDIIQEFLDSGKDLGCVNVEGRTPISIYNALLSYVKRHDEFNVSVRMNRGDVILEKHG